jgi:peptide/nickel transport system permease protein
MVTFIVRRLVATVLVLLAASFVVYLLSAGSGDPLIDLKGSSAANKQTLIEHRIETLHLTEPVPVRYAYWLGGASKCLIGQCDLGESFVRGAQPVTKIVAAASGSTIQLITGSVIIALILGIAVGMVSAIRQYSGFDYVITFISFVLYSLPIFFVAVLLKEYGAIRFNEFLDDPVVTVPAVIFIGLLTAVVWASIVGGAWRRRLIVGGSVGLAAALILAFLGLVGWFSAPALGIAGVAFIGLVIAIAVTAANLGLTNRRGILASVAAVAVWVALYTPLQYLFFGIPEAWTLILLGIASLVIGVLCGIAFGKDDKRQLARSAAITSFFVFLVVVADRVLLVFPDYVNQINGSIVATIGSSTPGLQGDMWFHMLDAATHLVLPTIALAVVSFAGYTRYARSSLLEVMNQDYVRTARAKGLTERTVIMRHAFRNALIPIATIVAFDVGALIGGAIITERIFGWKGMGSVFSEGLDHTDVNLIMGFFLVTGVVAVIFNFLADLAYAALDPRIRVN